MCITVHSITFLSLTGVTLAITSSASSAAWALAPNIAPRHRPCTCSSNLIDPFLGRGSTCGNRKFPTRANHTCEQGIFQDLEHGGVSTNPWGGPSLPLFLLPSLSRPSLFPFLRSRAPPLPSHFPLPFSSLRSRAP